MINNLINFSWRHCLQCLWTLWKDTRSTATNCAEERQCSNQEEETDKDWSNEWPSWSLLLPCQDGINGLSNVISTLILLCLAQFLLAELPSPIPSSHVSEPLHCCLFSILWTELFWNICHFTNHSSSSLGCSLWSLLIIYRHWSWTKNYETCTILDLISVASIVAIVYIRYFKKPFIIFFSFLYRLWYFSML